MALSASALASQLKSGMKDLTSGAAAKFGDIVGKYIQQNAMVTHSWIGTGTTPPPASSPMTDPTVVVTSTQISGSTTIGQPADLASFGVLLTTMVTGFSITMGDATWSLSPSKFVGAYALTQSGADTFEGAMDAIANQIITQTISMATIPSSGIHAITGPVIPPGFTGSSTHTSIA